MQISNEVLKKIFAESFNEEISSVGIYDEKYYIRFKGKKYEMRYYPLEGYLLFLTIRGLFPELGIIHIHGCDVFSDGSCSFTEYIIMIRRFEFKLKKYIKSSKRRFHRKFTAR